MLVFKFVLLFLTFFLSTPFVSNAQENQPFKSGSNLPRIVSGKEVNLTEIIDTDLFIVGNVVNINTTVNGDVFMMGGEININGVINQDLIVVGNKVMVRGIVNGKLLVIGGTVVITESAQINSYMMGAGNLIELSGSLNGPARIAASNLLNINESASINGDLEAYVNESNISNKAFISGEKRVTQDVFEGRNKFNPNNLRTFNTLNIVSFISSLILLLLLVRLLGNSIVYHSEFALGNIFPTILWALIGLFITPIVAFLLIISIFTLPIGFILLLIYFLSIYLATIIGSIALGRWIYVQDWFKKNNLYLQSVLGYVVFTIIGITPYVGPLVRLFIFLLGLGIIFRWIKTLAVKRN